MPIWYVYIVSNRAHTLYTGMTNDLPQRVVQHNWPRAKRVAMIQSINPNWNDLSAKFDLARWLR